jgi:hypothetical protein
MKIDLASFGKMLREELGYDVGEMAEGLGIPKLTWEEFETKGHYENTAVRAVRKALGIDLLVYMGTKVLNIQKLPKGVQKSSQALLDCQKTYIANSIAKNKKK